MPDDIFDRIVDRAHLDLKGKVPTRIISKPEYGLMISEMDETLQENKRHFMTAMVMMKAQGGTD